MAKKQNPNRNAEVLALLKDILPKAVGDQSLVKKIYSACEEQISTRVKVESFDKFCTRVELPNLEEASVEELQRQFEENFGNGNVTIVADEKKNTAQVEVKVDGEVLKGAVKVGPREEENEDPEFKPKFVPFPISLESDPELVWVLGRGETLTTEEAAIQLSKIQDDFWGSKTGQNLLRKRVERIFPEFISRVPAKMLSEGGLKRHYKEPEALKQIRVESVVKKK
ncbi:MAG TPA: hypothetical protein VEH27_15190 [Methylomirabilota bacterium]|nr:hypothetical protein [Methylomirabilota bacterium]